MKRHWTASGGVVRSAHGSGRALVLVLGEAKDASKGCECKKRENSKWDLLTFCNNKSHTSEKGD